VFGVLLGISLLNVWLLPAFITMDGPAHLYNASILNRLGSDSFFANYLDENQWFLPNYLSHWLLQLLLLKFHFLVSEKIVITLIILLTSISFRKLLIAITGKVPVYSFLIFPILFSNLLQHGFYNFCLSFGLLNLHLIFTIRFLKAGKTIDLVILMILGLLLYYCHLLGFGISIIVCSAYIIVTTWYDKKTMLKKGSLFYFVHLPGFIMTLLFSSKIDVPFYDYDLSVFEKSTALITFSSGIAFEKSLELPYTILITLLLIVLSTLIIANRKSEAKKLRVSDIFFVLSILFIYLIYHSKNGDLGGMFTQRQLCYCFYFLILWISCNAPKGFVTGLSLLLVFFVFCNISLIRYKIAESTQIAVSDVISARPFISDKSVVKTIVLSRRWFNSHISNYLGIGKDVLLTENYEASLGWFPLSWNKAVLNARDRGLETEPDYVFIYGNDSIFSSRIDETLKLKLVDSFHKVYESSDLFCKLYRRN
jgi:hypothetical protein